MLVERDFQSVNLGAWFVGDTARFHPWEAFHGQRFRIGAQYSPAVSGDNGTVTDYRIDYRKYAKLTRRSSFAWRLFGIISNAQETEFRRVFSAGGLNTIRGYDFYSFQGDRVYFSNFELRFPLVDRLDLPWGQFVDIRGVFFFDIGGAYYKRRRCGSTRWRSSTAFRGRRTHRAAALGAAVPFRRPIAATAPTTSGTARRTSCATGPPRTGWGSVSTSGSSR